MNPEEQGVEVQEQPVQAAPESETEATAAAATTPAAEVPAGQEDEMPTEPDKQKEAFIRMRQKIKEQEALLSQSSQQQAPQPEAAQPDEERVLDMFRQRHIPQVQISPEMAPDMAIHQVQQVAYQSQMTAQQLAEVQQELENERLWKVAPELNPENPDYNKPETIAFEKHLAGLMVMERLAGKNPNIAALARKAKSDFAVLTKPQQEAIAQETLAVAAKQEQATLEARGAHQNVPQQVDDTSFRKGANKGDVDAIAALLKG